MEKVILQSQTGANEIDNKDSGELIKTEQIEGTPFTIVETEEGAIVTMGKYMIKKGGTAIQYKKEIKKTDWQMLTAVIGVMIETIIEDKKEI